MSGDIPGTVLTIDLDAIAANYRLLCAMVAPAACAGVVKADAYGLGVERVAPALAAAGCKDFFVANIDEGMRLRGILKDAGIHVFNGFPPGFGPLFADNRLIPVLNSLAEIENWSAFGARRGTPLAADVHIDTGMSRLGLPPDELKVLAGEPERLSAIRPLYLMSHLACADEPDHPLNREQLAAFERARAALPGIPASLANSPGVFLGADYHFDLARPGVALCGVEPIPGQSNRLAQVVLLEGKVLQIRDVDTPQTVGYGATHRIDRGGKIATVAVGYADGYLRSLSNSGGGYFGGVRAPVVGRVSMDLITLDVTSIPENLTRPGMPVELIGPNNPLERVAEDAATIGYEILTGLGGRYHRVYKGGDA